MHIPLNIKNKNIIILYRRDSRQVADYVQNLYIMIHRNSVLLLLFSYDYSFIVRLTVQLNNAFRMSQVTTKTPQKCQKKTLRWKPRFTKKKIVNGRCVQI